MRIEEYQHKIKRFCINKWSISSLERHMQAKEKIFIKEKGTIILIEESKKENQWSPKKDEVKIDSWTKWYANYDMDAHGKNEVYVAN